MIVTEQEFNALLRTDLTSFVERAFRELHPETEYLSNWHIELICSALERCRQGKVRRLIINVPPRSLKSHIVSVCMTAWLLGHNPFAKIICLSYAQDLSDQLSRQTRALMMSAFYRGLFPTRLSRERNTVSEFVTTKGGFRMATSVGGVLTGYGSWFIIIDDPQKPDEALSEAQRNSIKTWFDNTVVSRLDDKRTGCIILIMQRLNEDDLTGHLQEQGDWEVLRLPAIAEEDEVHRFVDAFGNRIVHRRAIGEALHPERESLEILAGIRRVLGEFNFAGQYQQSPAPQGGGMVKGAWFRTYTDANRPESFDFIFQSWDTASKAKELNDYSVCTTWGVKGKNFYLLHVLRMRLEYPDLKRMIVTHARTFGARNVLIEDQASGIQLIQDLKRDGLHTVTRYSPKGEKQMRMLSVTPMIENGFVYLPETAEWLAAYLHELTTFPRSRFDDQADSTSQALDWAKRGTQVLGLAELYKAAREGRLSPEFMALLR